MKVKDKPFPLFSICQLICVDEGLALCLQSNSDITNDQKMIIGEQIDQSSLNQLWMIIASEQNPHLYKIVNCVSDMLLGIKGEYVRLRTEKHTEKQFFELEPTGYKNQYWIKPDWRYNQTLELNCKVLCLRMKNQKRFAQKFELRLLKSHISMLNRTPLLLNVHSKKALDIPLGSLKEGIYVIQYERNGRFNQRWKFDFQGETCVISSLLTGLVLDVKNSDKSSGTNVIQYRRKQGAMNQQWKLQETPIGIIIYSLVAQGMHLAIKDDSTENQEFLQITDLMGPSSYWNLGQLEEEETND